MGTPCKLLMVALVSVLLTPIMEDVEMLSLGVVKVQLPGKMLLHIPKIISLVAVKRLTLQLVVQLGTEIETTRIIATEVQLPIMMRIAML